MKICNECTTLDCDGCEVFEELAVTSSIIDAVDEDVLDPDDIDDFICFNCQYEHCDTCPVFN